MNGAGNDFMVMDARGGNYDFEALALELCKLTGADGFMATDLSDKADFRLHFYNADGSRGEMCGNGARCICKFAYDLGIAGETMTVQADAGIDVGDTLVGMHIRPVAVPLRIEYGSVGHANLVMAYSRLPYVGGSRAVYE